MMSWRNGKAQQLQAHPNEAWEGVAGIAVQGGLQFGGRNNYVGIRVHQHFW
jgi:hypothetical protein